jgi:hypothetical protein
VSGSMPAPPQTASTASRVQPPAKTASRQSSRCSGSASRWNDQSIVARRVCGEVGVCARYRKRRHRHQPLALDTQALTACRQDHQMLTRPLQYPPYSSLSPANFAANGSSSCQIHPRQDHIARRGIHATSHMAINRICVLIEA